MPCHLFHPGRHADLLDKAWVHILNYARFIIFDSSVEPRRQHTLSFLLALHNDLPSDASKRALEKLVSEIAKEVLGRCQNQVNNTEINEELLVKDWRTLEMLFERFGGILSRDEDDFIHVNASRRCALSTLTILDL